MPSAPFGLAYGIGAGVAGAQQQLMQHQVAQQQAEDQVFSQPVQPQMDQPTTQQAMQNILGTPAPMQGGIPMAPGTVAQGPSPALAQATAPTQHKYVTPYEKMAYEYGQRADKLAKMGFGRSAMALQQQAAQMYGQHMDVARGMAVQSILRGDKMGAVNALNSIGMPVTDVGKFQTPDGEMFYVNYGSGNTTLMTRSDLTAVSSDPSKLSDILARQDQYQRLYGWREDQLRSREQMLKDQITSREKQTSQRLQAQKDNWASRNATQKLVAGIRASAPSAEAKTVAAEARNVLAQNPDMSPEEAEATVWAQHRLEKGGSDPKLRAAINATTHISPYTQDPMERETLTNARNYINDILGKKGETVAPKPGIKTATSSGLVGRSTSKPDGAYHLNGKTVTVKGGKIISEE